MKNSIRNILLLMIMVLAGLTMTGCDAAETILSSRDMADAAEVYQTTEDTAAIFVNGLLKEDQAKIADGIYYLSEDFIRSALDKRFYWDGSSDRLLFTNADEQYEESVSDPSVAYVDENNENTLYISTDCLAKYVPVTISIYEEPGRVFIDTAGTVFQTATVSKNAEVRVKGGYKSDILDKVSKGDQVIVLQDLEKWSQVRTEDGYVGYMKLSSLDSERADESVESSIEDPEYTQITKDGPICIAWQDMESSYGNYIFDDLIKNVSNVNVVSPAWIALSDNKGNFKSLCSASYVKKAHSLGMDVWVLADDFSSDMSVGKVLGSNESRTNLIKKLIAEVTSVNADGINVDFEYITDSCGKDFIQFLRELRIACHEKNLVLSVDNANPTFVKYCYDMTEQGKIADYVILMQYDEHWQGSEAGSVSSYPYVKAGVEAALEMVPAERLISGLPFYTRVWTETPEEYAEAGAEIRDDGNSEYSTYALDSKVLSMDEAQSLVDEAGVTPEWDDSIGQYYAEIPLKHGKQRIWIEDLKSLEEKLSVGKENNLAGYSFWRLGMENDDVWDLIGEYLN